MKQILFGILILLLFPTYVTSANENENQPEKIIKTGTASFYHPKFNGRKTANGEIFDNNLYTCASNHFKLGTYLKVTNIANKKVVYVKVNDRMGHQGRVIDLTSRSAKDLGFYSNGLTKVKIEVVHSNHGIRAIIAQLNGNKETEETLKPNEL